MGNGDFTGEPRPVLYLDLDDTVVSWETGEPEPADGVEPFLMWALDRFEVRWLTSWAPSGRMSPRLLHDLSKITSVPVERLREIDGLDWEVAGSKIDGIMWLEHVVHDRPFVWVEDGTVKSTCLDFLSHHGYLDRYIHCDVTHDRDAVRVLHRKLERMFGRGVEPAPSGSAGTVGAEFAASETTHRPAEATRPAGNVPEAQGRRS